MGLKSHGVNSLEDLKGKKVAYASGTSSETILKRALNSVGLTMDDIEAYDMEVSNMVSAIVSGSIDACAPWSPPQQQLQTNLAMMFRHSVQIQHSLISQLTVQAGSACQATQKQTKTFL